jgi:hypothetical protein
MVSGGSGVLFRNFLQQFKLFDQTDTVWADPFHGFGSLTGKVFTPLPDAATIFPFLGAWRNWQTRRT